MNPSKHNFAQTVLRPRMASRFPMRSKSFSEKVRAIDKDRHPR